MSGLKQKTKFGKDIFKTLADAYRTNYDLWNTLQFEKWIRLEDAEAELNGLRQKLQELSEILEENNAPNSVWEKFREIEEILFHIC